MVWLHGGAFLMGSANRPATWGANLARRRDVVVVSVHHRLHALGHLDLSAFGEEFRESANVGMLDIVAALQWVNRNIEAFGGDPSCVTVFGQSGGGAKVATLLTMPAAHGLFHRAIIQSSSCAINDADKAERLSARFLERLGITNRNLAELFDMPIERIVETATAVSAAPLHPGEDWRPKVDGVTILQKPFEPEVAPLSAGIPLMIGGTRHEFAPEPERGPLPDAELQRLLAVTLGDDAAGDVTAQLCEMYPGLSNNELLALVNVQPFRAHHVRQAEIAAVRPAAPTYHYNFAWKSPNLDGLPLAHHGAELPFVFDNVAECAILTGNRPDAHALADLMSRAWAAFAASGDPARGSHVVWDRFDPERRNTMVFDTDSRQVDWPWRAETEAIVAAAGGLFAKPGSAALMRS
jgi:para-nitrobenzyl esterase